MNISNLIDEMEAKNRSLPLLRDMGYKHIQQLDWIAKRGDRWETIELKNKELWVPGSNYPHLSAGLNISQLKLREKLREELGLRTYFLNYAKGTDKVYGAYLDDLEQLGEYYDTPNRIRVYPIKYFWRHVVI